jgi:uncharacterized membrane protein
MGESKNMQRANKSEAIEPKQTDFVPPVRDEATTPAPISRWFKDLETADEAYRVLTDMGYGHDEINVVMSETTRERIKKVPETVVHHDATPTEEGSTNQVLAGTAAMSAIGAIGGVVAAVGTTILIPGLGLIIAGPMAGIGAGVGALIGSMYGVPISSVGDDEETKFKSEIESGRVLLRVVPHNATDAELIRVNWDHLD